VWYRFEHSMARTRRDLPLCDTDNYEDLTMHVDEEYEVTTGD